MAQHHRTGFSGFLITPSEPRPTRAEPAFSKEKFRTTLFVTSVARPLNQSRPFALTPQNTLC